MADASEKRQPGAEAPPPPKADTDEEVRRRFADAYLAYLRALQDAWTSEEVRRRSDEALRTLYAAARDAYPIGEVQKAVDEATRRYVRAVQELWSSVDAERIDPWTLSAVAQSLQAAAGVAASWGVGQPRGDGGWGWWPQVEWTWAWCPQPA